LKPFVVGVDAYKGGWVAVTLRAGSFHDTCTHPTIEALLDHHPGADVIAVDIPIGLPSSALRQADLLARTFIGSRRSSVFMTPPRQALDAATYQDALATARSLAFGGISRQSYGLAGKILEVDVFAQSDGRIVEAHPEVSFCAMAGKPLAYSKKTWNGAFLRRRLLTQNGIVVPDDAGSAGRVPVDDLLDAAAAAWTAHRVANGIAVSLPDPPEQLSDARAAAIWY
jgi:predicted RNase H-like nuclease